MKKAAICVGLTIGLVGPLNAGQTIVAGPVETGFADPSNEVLFCSATNLSNESRTLKYAILLDNGNLVAAPGESVVGSLVTETVGDFFGALCVWQIEGSAESWRFSACVGSSVSRGCTGGTLEGRFAPGMKFPGN